MNIDDGIKYEFLGNNYKALEVYSAILKDDKSNIFAIDGIKRLSGVRKRFKDVDIQALNFFIDMRLNSEYVAFEKWLLSKGSL